MRISERYRIALERFETLMPDPETELHYTDPFSLLVAVILSAQCTDARVNTITPALLAAYPDATAMAAATPGDILPYIKSITYPNNKSKLLWGMASKLVSDFDGIVPDNPDNLMTLPGVGRKTANVMLAVMFGQAAMPVDTHVYRVSRRLGLVPEAATVRATERRLTQHIPADKLSRAHHWLILHGRYVCKAQRPACDSCELTDVCLHYQRKHSNQ